MTQKSSSKMKGIMGIILVLMAVAVLASGCTGPNKLNSESSASEGNASETEQVSDQSDSTASEQPQSDSKSDGEQNAQEKEEEQKPAQPVGDLLSQVAYYGDRDSCQMTSDMAKAYQEALETLPQTTDIYWCPGEIKFQDAELKATLLDVSDDGYPILATFYQDAVVSEETGTDVVTIWEYRDGKAQKVSPDFQISPKFEGEYTALYIDASVVPNQLVFEDGEIHEAGEPLDRHIYSVSKGAVSHEKTYQYRGGYILDDGESVEYDDISYDPNNPCTSTVSELTSQGWTMDSDIDGVIECLYCDGVPIEGNPLESLATMQNSYKDVAGFPFTGYYQLEVSPAADMIQALKAVSSS